MALNQDVSQDETRGIRSIERIRPRVVDQVSELCEHCVVRMISIKVMYGQLERVNDSPMGSERPLMRPPIIMVVPSTDVPTELRTSLVRIFKAFPNSFIISGSQCTENTSPTIESSVENGKRTSSPALAM